MNEILGVNIQEGQTYVAIFQDPESGLGCAKPITFKLDEVNDLFQGPSYRAEHNDVFSEADLKSAGVIEIIDKSYKKVEDARERANEINTDLKNKGQYASIIQNTYENNYGIYDLVQNKQLNNNIFNNYNREIESMVGQFNVSIKNASNMANQIAEDAKAENALPYYSMYKAGQNSDKNIVWIEAGNVNKPGLSTLYIDSIDKSIPTNIDFDFTSERQNVFNVKEVVLMPDIGNVSDMAFKNFSNLESINRVTEMNKEQTQGLNQNVIDAVNNAGWEVGNIVPAEYGKAFNVAIIPDYSDVNFNSEENFIAVNFDGSTADFLNETLKVIDYPCDLSEDARQEVAFRNLDIDEMIGVLQDYRDIQDMTNDLYHNLSEVQSKELENDLDNIIKNVDSVEKVEPIKSVKSHSGPEL